MAESLAKRNAYKPIKTTDDLVEHLVRTLQDTEADTMIPAKSNAIAHNGNCIIKAAKLRLEYGEPGKPLSLTSGS